MSLRADILEDSGNVACGSRGIALCTCTLFVTIRVKDLVKANMAFILRLYQLSLVIYTNKAPFIRNLATSCLLTVGTPVLPAR